MTKTFEKSRHCLYRVVMSLDLQMLRPIFSASLASDALDALGHRNQVLAASIEMLSGEGTLMGFAFPVEIEVVTRAPEIAYVGLLTALDAVGKDQVYVTPTQRLGHASLWGELLSTACSFKGVAGALTDGPVRDLTRTRAMGFKVFGVGSSPLDINSRYEVIAHNVAGVIDGVTIHPGDLIVADVDGVVIVPISAIDSVISHVKEKDSGESEFRKAVKSGMSPSAAFAKFGVL